MSMGENLCMLQGDGRSASGFVPVDKGQLYYETCGTGRLLVFIHASGLNSHMWDEQWDFFSQYYQVLRYDLRNLGLSTSAPGRFFYHHDLAALLDALAQEQAILVGLAGGAAVAIDFAIEYPQRVTSLVLGSPTIGGGLQKVYTQEEKAYLLGLRQIESHQAVDFMLRKWVDGPYRTPDEVPFSKREYVKSLYTNTFTQRNHLFVLPRIMTPPAFERLQEIRSPVLILTGGYDMESILVNAVLLESRIAGARKVVLPSAGHLINIEASTVFNQLVHDFLMTEFT
jgi:3-oxoadipate enol-lactonase